MPSVMTGQMTHRLATRAKRFSVQNEAENFLSIIAQKLNPPYR
jgi:hypothetical protein